MNYIGFFIVILFSNIIQGITGFAGTILAMPPSMMLVGYNVAKPVLNVLAIISGIYVLSTNGKNVDKKELKKVVLVMAVGMLGGFFVKSLFVGKEKVLYKCLGIFVMALSVQGMYSLLKNEKSNNNVKSEDSGKNSIKNYLLLIGSGVAHGMFVCGGPLLIGYLSKTIKEKGSFRATISTVWIILNSIILLDDIHAGLWTPGLIKIQIIAIPVLLIGMAIGTKLYKWMSQQLFMKITYVLLFISGISLLIK